MKNTLPKLQTYRDAPDRVGSGQSFYRKVQCQKLARIHWGSYVDSAEELSRRRRHELKVLALSQRGLKDFKLVGTSAASYWNIWLQRDPIDVEIFRRDSGQRSRKGYKRKTCNLNNPSFVQRPDGIWVLDVIDTVVSLVVGLDRRWAVVAMDCLLRRLVLSQEFTEVSAKERVMKSINKLVSKVKQCKVQDILEFSTWLSMSPGESLSRVEIYDSGLEIPELQVRFDDGDGLIAVTDMYFRDSDVVGEFDGRIKYTKPEYLNGRSVQDVVIAEKYRENRLRQVVKNVVRWTWSDLQEPGRLARLLREAGVQSRDQRSVDGHF